MKLKVFLVFIIFNYTAKAQKDPELFPANDRKVGQLGYYLSGGTNVVKPQFCSASYLTEGYYMVSKAEHEVDNDGNRKENHIPNTEKFALLDSKGNFLINYSSNYALISIHHKMIEVGRNKLYGVVNDSNEVVIPIIYEDFHIQNENLIIARKMGKAGILSKNNEVIVPFIYDSLYSFHENEAKNNFYAIVAKNNKKAIIDKNNNQIIPFTTTNLQFATEKSICIKKDNKFVLVDYKIKPILATEFDVMYLVGIEATEIYAKDGSFGYYFTLDGKLLRKEELDGEKKAAKQ